MKLRKIIYNIIRMVGLNLEDYKEYAAVLASLCSLANTISFVRDLNPRYLNLCKS